MAKQVKKAQSKPTDLPAAGKQPASKTGQSVNIKLIFLLGILSLLAYVNTLRNGFTLDDFSVISNNTIVIKGISAIPEILATPYRRGICETSNDLYRPLSLVTFATEHQFFGSNPAPYHLFNILLYAGCVILLFVFLDKFFDRKKTAVAFIASLLFALHPIHTEVVGSVKSRDELLCFFFSFLSLNIFLNYIKTGKPTQLLLGAFCFFLSFLAKETVVTFLAVIPLIFFFYKNDNIKRSVYITISAVVVVVICLIARFAVLNYYNANNAADIDFMDNVMAAKSLPSDIHLATAFLVLGYYVKLLFIPHPLICDYSYNSIPLVSFSDPAALVSLILYIFLIVFAIWRFRKNHKDPYAFGIFFFLITISLFSNIPFLIGTTMGERLVFFPSVGFCLVMALLIERWVGNKDNTGWAMLKHPKVLAIIIPVSVIYTVATINRNSDWHDNFTLYSTDIQKTPEDSRLNFFVGYELQNHVVNEEKDPAMQRQKREEAIIYLRKAVAIHPEYADAQAALGDAFYYTDRFDSSEAHLLLALKQTPKNVSALNDLAGIYFNRKDYPNALETYKKAFALNPNFVNPCANIGVCYLYTGKFDSAMYYTKKAMSIDPDYNLSYKILAAVYKATGNIDSAKKYEAIAQKKEPAFKL